MGEALQAWPVSKCQIGMPVFESRAVKVPPVSPKNTSPPAVASVPDPPPFSSGYSQAFRPVRMSTAWMKLWLSPCCPPEPPKNRSPIFGGVGSFRTNQHSSVTRVKYNFVDGSKEADAHFAAPVWHVSVPSSVVSKCSVTTGRPSFPYPVVQFCLPSGVASSNSPFVRSRTKKNPFTSACTSSLLGLPSHCSSARINGPLASQSCVSCGVN